jgi:hypothetical protein
VIQHTWSSLIALLARIPNSAGHTRALVVSLFLTPILIVGGVAVLIQQSQTNIAAAGASPVVVARADFHSETEFQGKDLEVNVAISQTGDDCQAALNGGVCLRYSVVLDEKPIMAGYGVIPIADVHVTASSIVVTVDTSKVPNFVYVVGRGGPIAISWKTVSPKAAVTSDLVNKPQKATVQGSIASYVLPGPSTGAIATIIYR